MANTYDALALALDDEFVERLAREYQYQPEAEEPPITHSPDPSVHEIKDLVQTSFWASLTREEGRFHDFKLVFMPVGEMDEGLFVFKVPLDFKPAKLAKDAPALLPNFHVGVWRKHGETDLEIWGFAPSDAAAIHPEFSPLAKEPLWRNCRGKEQKHAADWRIEANW